MPTHDSIAWITQRRHIHPLSSPRPMTKHANAFNAITASPHYCYLTAPGSQFSHELRLLYEVVLSVSLSSLKHCGRAGTSFIEHGFQVKVCICKTNNNKKATILTWDITWIERQSSQGLAPKVVGRNYCSTYRGLNFRAFLVVVLGVVHTTTEFCRNYKVFL